MGFEREKREQRTLEKNREREQRERVRRQKESPRAKRFFPSSPLSFFVTTNEISAELFLLFPFIYTLGGGGGGGAEGGGVSDETTHHHFALSLPTPQKKELKKKTPCLRRFLSRFFVLLLLRFFLFHVFCTEFLAAERSLKEKSNRGVKAIAPGGVVEFLRRKI